MESKMVGLIGSHDSATLERLERAVQDRGARTVRIDLAGFPERFVLSVGRRGTSWTQEGSLIVLEELGALYVAHGEYMSPLPTWIPSIDEWAPIAPCLEDAVRRHQEARSVRASVYRLASDAIPVVNPARSHRACLLTPNLLRRLADGGIPVAHFVSGNDLEQIAYFVHRHAGECRARRLGCPSWEEWPLDLDYLRDHHLDFDEFPLIVRQAGGGHEIHVLVVGGQCAGVSTRDSLANRWAPAPTPSPEVQRIAIEAVHIAGLHLALVHIERGAGVEVVGLDPEPDLARLDDEARIACIPVVADHLLALSAHHHPLARPERQDDHTIRPYGELRSVPERAKVARRRLRIGITGLVSNDEVAAVARAVELRGHTPVHLEFPLFPLERALHECESGGRVALDQLADLDAVFVRSTGAASPVDATLADLHTPWPDRRVVFCRIARDRGESFLFQYSVLEKLGRRIPVINPPLAQEVHRTKVHQLFSLMRAGFPVPATLAGNDRDACARFVEEQGGEQRVVVKPLAGIYKTTLLSERGLEASLASGPVILQRYIRGDTIRAYLVGGRLIGAAKSLCAGDAVDSSVGQYGVQVVSLPDGVSAAGWAAAQHLGLSWTGMDFIRDAATGECFILECNAAAMFVNFSAMTGFDVAGALADHLVELGAHHADSG